MSGFRGKRARRDVSMFQRLNESGKKAFMDYRQLGQSGLRISTLTLGTMMFGGQTDDATAQRIIGAAQEQGVNSIDTADVM
jgi:hypothetical protein